MDVSLCKNNLVGKHDPALIGTPPALIDTPPALIGAPPASSL
jgi:hypothetical protein